MDGIKKISKNISFGQAQEKETDLYTLLKTKYSKFLEDAKKSETGNSVTRYENELKILDELIREAESVGDKAGLEGYEKKAQEIVDTISQMKIEILPAYTTPLLYRPAIYMEPDKNDGSKEEKIYALAKFYTIDENGEEIPLFEKKEIKEFLKNEELYNDILLLTSVVKEDGYGATVPFFTKEKILDIANNENIEINKETISRLKTLASTQIVEEKINEKYKETVKEKKPEENLFFNGNDNIEELVQDEKIYKNTQKLLEIRNEETERTHNISIFEPNEDIKTSKELLIDKESLFKFAKSEKMTNDFVTLSSFKYKPMYEEKEKRYFSTDNIKKIIENNIANDVYRLINTDLEKLYSKQTNEIISDSDKFINVINLLNLKNDKGEQIINKFESIDKLLKEGIDISDEKVKNLIEDLANIKDKNNKNVYSEEEIVKRVQKLKEFDEDIILYLSNIFYTNENGEQRPYIAAEYITDNQKIIENYEKIANKKFINKKGIEENLYPPEYMYEIIYKYKFEIPEKVEKFVQFAKETYYIDQNGEEKRAIEDKDINNFNFTFQFDYIDIRKEDIQKFAELIAISDANSSKTDATEFREYNDGKVLIDIIDNRECSYLIENFKQLLKIYNRPAKYPVEIRNFILDYPKNARYVDDELLNEVDKILKHFNEKNDNKISIETAFRAVMCGVTKEKIQEITDIKSRTYDSRNNTIKETNMFPINEIGGLVDMPGQIDNALKIAKLTYKNETGEELTYFSRNHILSFLSGNKNFEYNEDFEKNIEKLINLVGNKYYSDSYGIHKSTLLQLATDNERTQKFIETGSLFNNNYGFIASLEFYLEILESNDNMNSVLDLCKYVDKNGNVIFNAEEIKYILEEPSRKDNLEYLGEKLGTKTDGKIITPYFVGSIERNLHENNIKIDDAFKEKFEEIRQIQFDGNYFLDDKTALFLLSQNAKTDDIKEASKYLINRFNPETQLPETNYYFTKEKLIDICEFNSLDIGYEANKLNSLSKNVNGQKICLVSPQTFHKLEYPDERFTYIKDLQKEEGLEDDKKYDFMSDIIEYIEPDKLKTIDYETIETIARLKYFKNADGLIENLKVIGDIDFCIDLSSYTGNEELKELKEFTKFYTFNAKNQKIEKAISGEDAESILHNDKRKEAVLRALNYRAKDVNGNKIGIFSKTDIQEIIKNPELINIIENEIENSIPKENLENYSGKTIITAAKNINLLNKKSIDEISPSEKRKLINLIMENSADLSIFNTLKNDFPLLPITQEDYCILLQKLVSSIQVEQEKIDKSIKEKFLTKDLLSLTEELKKTNLNKIEIKQKFSSEAMINEILAAQQEWNISDEELESALNNFGFEINNGKIIGYPIVPKNNQKINEIKNENTRNFTTKILSEIVKKFTTNNEIQIDGKKELANILNNIFAVFPELHTTINEKSNISQNETKFLTTLKTIQEIIKNKQFESLPENDKQLLLIATILREIAQENDLSSNAKKSAFDTALILKKLNLEKSQENKIYDLINNQNWSQRAKYDQRNLAFNFRDSNILDIAIIMEKATASITKQIKEKDIDAISQETKKLIKDLQKTQPLLPNTQFPKGSEIKEGKGVRKTQDGVSIIKLNEVENFEEIGFPKGTKKDNVKFLVHALDKDTQLANFNTFSLIDSNALLSTSYLTNPYEEYHVFRTQGLILETDTLDVHAGSNMDYGSGYKKDIETLKNEYIFGKARRGNDRTFFSELIKIALGTTDEEKTLLNAKFKKYPERSKQIVSEEAEKISDEKYIEIIEKYQNMSFAQIQNEDPDFANELIKIFDIIENCNRSHGRKYNEVLVTRPKIKAVFMMKKDFATNNEIHKKLYDFAKNNDLPIVVLGNEDVEELENIIKKDTSQI